MFRQRIETLVGGNAVLTFFRTNRQFLKIPVSLTLSERTFTWTFAGCWGQLKSQRWRMEIFLTLRSQIEGCTRLSIFRKFSTLPAVIWASSFINFQEDFQLSCFSPTQMKKFPPSPLLLEPTRLSNLKKNSSLPFY